MKCALSTGGDEQRIALDAAAALKERVQHVAMLDNLRAFDGVLRKMPAAGIDTELKMYPGQKSYFPSARGD